MFNKILLAHDVQYNKPLLVARLKITVGEREQKRGYDATRGYGACVPIAGMLQVSGDENTRGIIFYLTDDEEAFSGMVDNVWDDVIARNPNLIINETTGARISIFTSEFILVSSKGEKLFDGIATGEECIIAIYA